MGWHPVARQAADRFQSAVRHGSKILAAAAVGAAAYGAYRSGAVDALRQQISTRGLARRDGPRLMDEYRRHRATVPEDDGNDDWNPRR